MKLAVLCDLLEERWFSMDLLADMLIEQASRMSQVEVTRVRPQLPSRLAELAVASRERSFGRWGYRAAIGVGRYLQYPLRALVERGAHDFFHVTDHSYAHLLFELPSARTGVFCHDIDAFRPWLETRAARPARVLAGALLAGLRRARLVFHSSLPVREDLLRHRLVQGDRLVHAPYGVAAEFQPEPRAEDSRLAGRPPFVLHVGSLIPRKNPEFLLQLVAALCRTRPELEVYQIGGTWTSAQRTFLEAAGIASRVHQIPHLGRPELSAYCRAAGAVILPSLAEGFGLPVVEALACGAPVVVSDIPVLTSVGADAVVARPPGDLDAWRVAVLEAMAGGGPSRERRLARAAHFSWAAHARAIVQAYERLDPSAAR
ncbi:MAG TPA: glycosyltransferase [Polyangiaceae bacterium]|nr:glycosyltransferase [Polyangiaceae bacterium]